MFLQNLRANAYFLPLSKQGRSGCLFLVTPGTGGTFLMGETVTF